MGVAPSPAAATPGLIRSDPHGPGISRVRDQARFRYLGPSPGPAKDPAGPVLMFSPGEWAAFTAAIKG